MPFTCESIRGSLTKCRHNTFRDAFAQMFDRLKKSATLSAVNILDVQTEPRYLFPGSDLDSKKPADVFLTCNKTFKISTSDSVVKEASRIAFDVTCTGPPALMVSSSDKFLSHA